MYISIWVITVTLYPFYCYQLASTKVNATYSSKEILLLRSVCRRCKPRAFSECPCVQTNIYMCICRYVYMHVQVFLIFIILFCLAFNSVNLQTREVWVHDFGSAYQTAFTDLHAHTHQCTHSGMYIIKSINTTPLLCAAFLPTPLRSLATQHICVFACGAVHLDSARFVMRRRVGVVLQWQNFNSNCNNNNNNAEEKNVVSNIRKSNKHKNCCWHIVIIGGVDRLAAWHLSLCLVRTCSCL